MKKIFVLTGEPSGDKLASTAISKLQKDYPDIEYLSVGGSNLRKIGIESIFDLKEITYLGFTSVLLNIFKINKRINQTVKEILKFNPDILFSVDSPDFTLRVAEKVKKINPQIKTIHYVAPQVWIWRKGRVKKIKKFIDHILLLFYFEKSFFEKFESFFSSIIIFFSGKPIITLIFFGLITIYSTFLAFKLEASFEVADFFNPQSDFVKGLDKLDYHLGDTTGEIGLIYIKGSLDNPEAIADIRKLVERLDSKEFLAHDSKGNLLLLNVIYPISIG